LNARASSISRAGLRARGATLERTDRPLCLARARRAADQRLPGEFPGAGPPDAGRPGAPLFKAKADTSSDSTSQRESTPDSYKEWAPHGGAMLSRKARGENRPSNPNAGLKDPSRSRTRLPGCGSHGERRGNAKNLRRLRPKAATKRPFGRKRLSGIDIVHNERIRPPPKVILVREFARGCSGPPETFHRPRHSRLASYPYSLSSLATNPISPSLLCNAASAHFRCGELRIWSRAVEQIQSSW